MSESVLRSSAGSRLGLARRHRDGIGGGTLCPLHPFNIPFTPKLAFTSVTLQLSREMCTSALVPDRRASSDLEGPDAVSCHHSFTTPHN